MKAIFYMDESALNERKVLFSMGDVLGIPDRSDFKDSQGTLLVLALPAGAHAIDSWQIEIGNLRIFPKKKSVPLTFEVRSGAVTYLGNLHANLQKGKNLFGKTVTSDGYPEIRDRQQRDVRMFEERYPQYTGKVTVELLRLGAWAQPNETQRQVDIPLIIPLGR